MSTDNQATQTDATNPDEIATTQPRTSVAEQDTVTITVGSAAASAKTEEKQEIADSKDIARDISDIKDFAAAKLNALGNATFSAEQYAAASAKLKELKDVISGFGRLLARSNAALLDEKAQLMKRLEEISRATGNAPMKKEDSPSWADRTEVEEKQNRRRAQSRQSRQSLQFDDVDRRGNSPVDSLDFPIEPKHPHRSRDDRRKQKGPKPPRDDDDSSQKQHRQRGSRIPPASLKPLNRRVVADDIEGFVIVIKPDPSVGHLITFAPPFNDIMIGGSIEVVPERPGTKPHICEPLYLEGMCNCTTNALVLHTGRPLHITTSDFIGILHKFINNYNGNAFHPYDRAKNHVDAMLLRCVIHAIVKIKGISRGQVALTINSFADATEPRNMLNAIGDYYNRRGDVDPMSIARGLFVAVATHFVSS
jgi:hypothetical protein